MSNPKLELLTPDNCQLIFIDQQPQMAFGVQSIDRQTLKNNVVGLARAGKAFGIPTVITTVETESFSGHTYPELLDVFPDAPLLERTSMNSWDDQKVRDAVPWIDALRFTNTGTEATMHALRLARAWTGREVFGEQFRGATSSFRLAGDPQARVRRPPDGRGRPARAAGAPPRAHRQHPRPAHDPARRGYGRTPRWR